MAARTLLVAVVGNGLATRQGYLGALFAHPMRMSMFVRLAIQGEASSKELAAQLDTALVNVSNHLRVMLKLGVVRVSREELRRGNRAHYYVATTTPEIVFRALVDGTG